MTFSISSDSFFVGHPSAGEKFQGVSAILALLFQCYAELQTINPIFTLNLEKKEAYSSLLKTLSLSHIYFLGARVQVPILVYRSAKIISTKSKTGLGSEHKNYQQAHIKVGILAAPTITFPLLMLKKITSFIFNTSILLTSKN